MFVILTQDRLIGPYPTQLSAERELNSLSEGASIWIVDPTGVLKIKASNSSALAIIGQGEYAREIHG